MNEPMPVSVAMFFQLSNERTLALIRQCFAAQAVVQDEGATHVGHEAIEVWMAQSQQRFTYQVTPQEVQLSDEHIVVRAELNGNFLGSPVTLRYAFELAEGVIVALRIAA